MAMFVKEPEDMRDVADDFLVGWGAAATGGVAEGLVEVVDVGGVSLETVEGSQADWSRPGGMPPS